MRTQFMLAFALCAALILTAAPCVAQPQTPADADAPLPGPVGALEAAGSVSDGQHAALGRRGDPHRKSHTGSG
jgi:hypothetical protein